MPDSLDDLNKRLKEFATKRDWEQFHSPKNLSMALIAEAAELIEHFQWLKEEDSYHLSEKQLKEVSHEMADILIFLIRLSERLGINLIDAANVKIAINEKRFPIETFKGFAGYKHD
ncbi:MAG: nucleotide pyrophosphohydrolase [Gammaproteobacteria bacterium]|nr:nucleotide pyrophosphohydrolase [Gammaproteobacteria bacterium]